jgi:hypothetical protein
MLERARLLRIEQVATLGGILDEPVVRAGLLLGQPALHDGRVDLLDEQPVRVEGQVDRVGEQPRLYRGPGRRAGPTRPVPSSWSTRPTLESENRST